MRVKKDFNCRGKKGCGQTERKEVKAVKAVWTVNARAGVKAVKGVKGVRAERARKGTPLCNPKRDCVTVTRNRYCAESKSFKIRRARSST